jgi:predicted DNA-binding transcriptional regulator AlpA
MNSSCQSVSVEGKPVLMGMGEILTLAGISRSTLSRWRRRGEFPPPLERPGRRLAWYTRDVLTVLKIGGAT